MVTHAGSTAAYAFAAYGAAYRGASDGRLCMIAWRVRRPLIDCALLIVRCLALPCSWSTRSTGAPMQPPCR